MKPINKNLCESCSRHLYDTTCFIPSGTLYKGKPCSIMSNTREYLIGGTCKYYNKLTNRDKLVKWIGYKKYALTRYFVNIRVFFVDTIYGWLRYGFDTSCMYDLPGSMTKYIYPRIKYLYESVKNNEHHCMPSGLERAEFIEEHQLEYLYKEDDAEMWLDILGILHDNFKRMHEDSLTTGQDYLDSQEALRLFAIFYNDLVQ